MKITVFGASGKSGQLIVDKALNMGVEVLAYVRRKNSISKQHPNLKILVGELSDADKIREAVKGADACISALGGASLSKHSIQVIDGINLIVTQMEKQGIKRFLYLSSFGAGESKQFMSPLPRFIIIKLILRVPIADHNLNEEQIKNSKLEWTIFRPGSLSNGPLKKTLTYGYNTPELKGNLKISRSSLAQFMLNQVAEKEFINKAIWVHE